MNSLLGKRILLGVSGGIAAYKSADLVRKLRERGADVRVVMTRSACEFITPLTMQAVSGKPVHVELLDYKVEGAMGHIDLARWADVILVAPASANFMSRVAQGQADDLLSTLCLAASVPVMLAPAMNQQMWLNPATQRNVALLKDYQVTLLGPGAGDQACGETGPGRMLEPLELIDALARSFLSDRMSGLKLVITAGPTREAIDPVRYISNRSSGRMGYAVARAASEAGGQVVLVSGPTAIDPPEHVQHCPVVTAAEMHNSVMAEIDDAAIFIAAAAVADYRCNQAADKKIKKDNNELELLLKKTPDILAAVANRKLPPFTVGFAAETHSMSDYAQQKLINKRLDMIAANQVGENQGFDTEDNELEVFWSGGGVRLERAPKEKLARQLIHLIANRYREKNTAQAH